MSLHINMHIDHTSIAIWLAVNTVSFLISNRRLKPAKAQTQSECCQKVYVKQKLYGLEIKTFKNVTRWEWPNEAPKS